MRWPLLRALLLIASAAASGVAYGRRRAAREVEKAKASIIEEASQEARRELHHQAGTLASTQSRILGLNLLIRAGVASAIFAIYAMGWLPRTGFVVLLSVVLTALMIRDAIRAYPTVMLGVRELRKHRWRPRLAVRELVAASVFARVLAEAEERPADRKQRLFLALAGHTPDDFTQQIAKEVADIARATSWDDIMPFIWWVGMTMVGFFAFYFGFLSLIFLALDAGSS